METVTASVSSSSAPTGSDKLWAVLCHLSSFLGVALVLPLIVYLVMKEESAYVRANAREAINFHLSLFIYTLACVPLIMVVIGIPLLIVLGIASFILAVIGAIKASDGGCYHYPCAIRFLRPRLAESV
jgi:hypothetical protein